MHIQQCASGSHQVTASANWNVPNHVGDSILFVARYVSLKFHFSVIEIARLHLYCRQARAAFKSQKLITIGNDAAIQTSIAHKYAHTVNQSPCASKDSPSVNRLAWPTSSDMWTTQHTEASRELSAHVHLPPVHYLWIVQQHPNSIDNVQTKTNIIQLHRKLQMVHRLQEWARRTGVTWQSREASGGLQMCPQFWNKDQTT
jgi:hypothetical protein